MNRPVVGRRSSRRIPCRLALPAAVGVGSLVLLAAIVPVASASGAWTPDPVHWTNGIVLCQFASATPAVNVSALNLMDSGLTVGLGGISELHPDGTVAASVDLSRVAWASTNSSTDSVYDLAYTLQAPLTGAGVGSPPVGSVDLRVDFTLPDYPHAAPAGLDTVVVNVSIANWTWQRAGDHLEATFTVAPTYPASEHLTLAADAPWLLVGTSNRTGTTLQWMGVAPTSLAQPLTGPAVNVSAVPSASESSPSSATVEVAFGSTAGSFKSLRFTSEIGILLPSTVGGVPLTELAAAMAAGVAGSLMIALFARRVRRHPSRLTYVDEDT